MPLISSFKPNLLTIVPPYTIWGPPAGAAALLAYMKALGCYDFGFLDLRLFAPNVASPTYRMTGAFGESYVIDIPDLPLVLAVLDRFRRDQDLLDIPDEIVEPFCIERGINSLHLRSYLQRIDHLIKAIFAQIPDLHFIGFSVWTSNYLTTLLAAAHLKRRRKPPYIVAGGPQVSQSTASAKLGLGAGIFDVVSVGEGEQTLLDLYSQFSSESCTVKGTVGGTITYDSASQMFKSNERPLLRLNELPLPDFDEMHLPAYSIAGKRAVTYQLSRGCTDKCSFCSEWVFWRSFRLMSIDKALEDVAELQRRWGAQRIWFTDSLLNGHLNRLREFAEGILSRGIQIEWNGYMRAQMDVDTANLLRRAGCSWVFIGVESLADETLKLMNKRRDEQQNLAAVQAFLDAGIDVVAGLIPGFPGDTRDRFIRTTKVLRKMQKMQESSTARLMVNHEPFVVLPGQPIYGDLEKYGLHPIPWPDNTLQIAPDFADIASKVWCRVEGPNQGLDRLGEYIISLSLTNPAQPAEDVAKENVESITPYDFSMTWIGNGAWLGRTVSQRGHLVGVILLDEERAWFLTQNQNTKICSTPLCELPIYSAKLEAILSTHLAAVSLLEPSVWPIKYRRLVAPWSTSARLVLGPLTIARLLGENLWLANIATGQATFLPSTNQTAVSLLAGREPALTEDSVALAELGILIYAELPEDAEVVQPHLQTASSSLTHSQ